MALATKIADASSEDVTAAASWEAELVGASLSGDSTDSYVTLDPSKKGLIKALKAGRVRIKAKLSDDLYAELSLTISDSPLASISLSPLSSTLLVGDQLQLTATGLLEDGTSLDLTRKASWTSADTNLLSVIASGDLGGKATALALGTTQVSASYEGQSASAAVTVASTLGTVPDPTFSVAAGSYSSTQSLSLSTALSGASIRYSTDGSTPTSSTGTVYSGPISLSSDTVVKAIAYKTNYADSAVVSASYVFVLPAPGSFSVSDGVGEVTYSFQAVSGASSYNIYYSSSSGVTTSSTTVSEFLSRARSLV